MALPHLGQQDMGSRGCWKEDWAVPTPAPPRTPGLSKSARNRALCVHTINKGLLSQVRC